MPNRTRRTFSQQFKLDAIAASAVDGVTKTANSLAISPSLIGRWRQALAPKGTSRAITATRTPFELETGPSLRRQRDEAIELAIRATKALLDNLG